MKRSILLALALLAVTIFAYQRMPAVMATHAKNLKEATSFKAKISVQEIGGAPMTVEVAYAKPNLLRIETAQTLIISDGETMTVLNKSENTYLQNPVTDEMVLEQAMQPSVWGWASFLQPDTAKLIKAAEAGRTRKVRGVEVSVATATLADGESTATFFFDLKSGIARGFTLKRKDKQWVVWAESVETSDAGMEEGMFVFEAPEGAELVVQAVLPVWASVKEILNSKCMPCHGQQRTSGVDVRTYESITRSRAIVPRNPERSRLIRALKGIGGTVRMPQGRAPLPPEDIQLIEDWITAGAENN